MALVSFAKPCTTPAEQVALLKSRGVNISDASEAVKYLSYHNYYYVSGYVYYFEKKGRERTHLLGRNVSFDEIVSLIRFDQTLREHCLKAVFKIESALRCVLAREISLAHGPFGLENPSIYRNPAQHPAFMNKLQSALSDHRNEPFISHFTRKYREPIPPAWVMMEILTFGTISNLYSKLRTDLQKKAANCFSVDHFILISWFRALTELRNTCAHHARLWNKVFVEPPKIRKADREYPILPERVNRLGSFVPLICHLLTVLDGHRQWADDLKNMLEKNRSIKPGDCGLSSYNF